jgi:hypothetical protein
MDDIVYLVRVAEAETTRTCKFYKKEKAHPLTVRQNVYLFFYFWYSAFVFSRRLIALDYAIALTPSRTTPRTSSPRHNPHLHVVRSGSAPSVCV